MPLTYEVSTAPTESIVLLSDVKKHLYVDTNDDDAMIQRFIGMAERYVGHWTQRALDPTEYKFYLDDFPSRSSRSGHNHHDSIDGITVNAGGMMRLPVSPVRSIVSIQYNDTDGAQQTLATSVYQSDIVSEPTRILPKPSQSWPATDQTLNNVIVTFNAGYVDLANLRSKKPELEQAVFLLVGEWYENRENATDAKLEQIPTGISNLLGLADVATEF